MTAEPGADLSDGVVVETDLVARVFGLRLLTVSGTVVLLPARPAWDGQVEGRRPTRPSRTVTSGAGDRPGARLAAVARRLDDNARRLARAAAGSDSPPD